MPTKKKPTKKAKKKKSEQKTKPTKMSVTAFLDKADVSRRDDAKAIVQLMERVTGERAEMWGTSIVGFGRVHYKYESGHEGDSALVGFSPRKTALTLYLWGDVFAEPSMQKLGKFKTGKGCLYIKSLADIDMKILEGLVATSALKVRSRFG